MISFLLILVDFLIYFHGFFCHVYCLSYMCKPSLDSYTIFWKVNKRNCRLLRLMYFIHLFWKMQCSNLCFALILAVTYHFGRASTSWTQKRRETEKWNNVHHSSYSSPSSLFSWSLQLCSDYHLHFPLASTVSNYHWVLTPLK